MKSKRSRRKRNVINFSDFGEVREFTDSVRGSGKTTGDKHDMVSSGLENISNSEQIIRKMLKMVLSTISIAESRYKGNPSDRNAYALNTLVDAAKHLIIQLETQSVSKKILGNIEPILKSESENIIKEITMSADMLRRSLMESIPRKSHKLVNDSMRSFMKDFGKALKSQYEGLISKIHDQMIAL